ncbi:hypothetical protein BB561_004043 [Smittium simulii]|uniref:Clathrin heavy chain n=1 Tax=Smittium simulii TaxID=133385 RepID=A0A2T9YIB1_9FUNG|nr:hypothetical protein BB561_004043 [Smittium simulii]
MSSQLPIELIEITELTDLGVDPKNINFNNVTLESDRFICIREINDSANTVNIVDTSNLNDIFKRPITADSALMNPINKIVALRADKKLQVFNLELSAKIKGCTLSEDALFWHWVSPFDLLIVTSKAVYKWSIEGTSDPIRVFLLHERLKSTQIISVTSNQNMTWFLVIGISEQQGRIAGTTQLFNSDKGVSQIIEAHAASFCEITLEGASSSSQALILASREAAKSQLSIVEIDHKQGNPTLEKRKVDINFPSEAVNDFPVAVQVSQKYGFAYVITKYGFFHIYMIETGLCVFSTRISGEAVFVSAPSKEGLICINRKGKVLAVKPKDATIIGHILATSQDVESAFKLATRANLPGAEDLYVQRFQQLLSNAQYMDAAALAARSPNGLLRTTDTIERLKHLPSTPGQLSPILNYFATILETGELNRYEAIELTRPVLAMNRKQLLENWLKENKLECSEELGDIVYEHDVTLALSIYLRAASHSKAVKCFVQLGQFDKIVLYTQKTGYTPNWIDLLNQASTLDADRARELASSLVKADPQLMTAEIAANILMSHNLVPQTTSFLLDILRENKPEDAALQTKLLEMNLLHAPQVADAILGNNVFTHFDKNRIAQLCERAGLLQRALELFSDIADIRRIVVQTGNLGSEWVINYLGKLSPENSTTILKDMLLIDTKQNLQTVVQASIKYSDVIGSQLIISLFEETNCMEGLYYYLGSVINTTTDSAVVFRYIQVACQVGQTKEVERVVRDNNHYDSVKVKNFLIESNLEDQLPLIIVCDKNGLVNDLILHLYRYKHFKSIEIYVQQVNPSKMPEVIGTLLDVDCDEDVIRGLLSSVNASGFQISELIDQVEKRGRLKMLRKLLEQHTSQGSTEHSIHNALAKIYIDSNIEPEHYLRTNTHYDGLVIGNYCENRDPGLAFIAYSSSQTAGKADKELVHLATSSSMFKLLAKYVIKRKDPALWSLILNGESDDSSNRKLFIDQVVTFGINETNDSEEISILVKSFMAANLPNELIIVLEKLLFGTSDFTGNKNLENLLILTAIQSEPSKVNDYIRRLNYYDASDIAQICLKNGLFEEALLIYKKNNNLAEAVGVLVDHIKNLDRAYEFAEQEDNPEVWVRLARAQLKDNKVSESIASYIRANNPNDYLQVIQCAQKEKKYNELIRYLTMARLKIREPVVESELMYAFAFTERLQDLQEMVKSPNIAKINEVGEKCYRDGFYAAAKILFTSISNWAQLAPTLLELEDYKTAVECCKKANSIVIWRQVNNICISKKEFKLAEVCGLNLIVNAEELDPLVRLYESLGHIDQVCQLLETGINLERAHMGIFTMLAVLYVKYNPDKAMDFLKLYWGRINIPKVIKICEQVHLWCELVFLYVHYEDYDSAISVMIEHGSDAFDHISFKELINKVSSLELMYKSIRFYLVEHPLLVNELLQSLMHRLDLTRVVEIFANSENTPLVKPFLEQAVQIGEVANAAVVEALHGLYLETHDYNALKQSITLYQNFDFKVLANKLKTHELIEFRRISVFLYNKLGMFNESITLSKKDKAYNDAIATAKLSNDQSLVHDLLQFFITYDQNNDSKDNIGDVSYVSCLNYNNHLINPSFVMELAFRYKKTDITMPFFINYTNNIYNQMNTLTAEVKSLKDQINKNQTKADNNNGFTGLGGRLMIGSSAQFADNTPQVFGAQNNINKF